MDRLSRGNNKLPVTIIFILITVVILCLLLIFTHSSTYICFNDQRRWPSYISMFRPTLQLVDLLDSPNISCNIALVHHG